MARVIRVMAVLSVMMMAGPPAYRSPSADEHAADVTRGGS